MAAFRRNKYAKFSFFYNKKMNRMNKLKIQLHNEYKLLLLDFMLNKNTAKSAVFLSVFHTKYRE